MFLGFVLTLLLGCCQRITSHVSSKWKILPGDVAARSEKEETELLSFIQANVPEALLHTGSAAFDQHLKGVQDVLKNWGADDHVCRAGLLHSIYGTEGFQGFKLPFSKRQTIRELIGTRAEKLVWIFCVVDRLSVDTLVAKHLQNLRENKDLCPQLLVHARIELGMFPIEFTDKTEWLDFLEMSLADWLEQVEGAAEKSNDLYGWRVGEAYSYRREAYHRMGTILAAERGPRLSRAQEMIEEVYATEGESTRALHQIQTPPMTEAAREARAALASASY